MNSVFAQNHLPKFSPPKKTVTRSEDEHGKKINTDYPIIDQWFLVRNDMQQSKMFYVIQAFETDEGKQFRVGNYIVGNTKNKWMWGQFCPWFREEDLTNLLNFMLTLKLLMPVVQQTP